MLMNKLQIFTVILVDDHPKVMEYLRTYLKNPVFKWAKVIHQSTNGRNPSSQYQ